MTKKEAWEFGYDTAGKVDYYSDQVFYIGWVLEHIKVDLKGIKTAVIEGIKDNWRDCKNA